MNADIAQVVERYIGNVEVTGPTPVISFIEKGVKSRFYVLFFCHEFCHDKNSVI